MPEVKAPALVPAMEQAVPTWPTRGSNLRAHMWAWAAAACSSLLSMVYMGGSEHMCCPLILRKVLPGCVPAELCDLGKASVPVSKTTVCLPIRFWRVLNETMHIQTNWERSANCQSECSIMAAIIRSRKYLWSASSHLLCGGDPICPLGTGRPKEKVDHVHRKQPQEWTVFTHQVLRIGEHHLNC